jgi:pimeloyl-ACP methyl ester carboxylesterase
VVLGKVEFAAIKYWENKVRAAQGIHRGSPGELLQPVPISADADYLRSFAGQTSLLFIHGTTSSTSGAFARLAEFPDTADWLWKSYAGRVLGFNHHTLTKSAAQNAMDFLNGLPEHEKTYEFDVVVHSRGGLVARAIAELNATQLNSLAKLNPPWKQPNVKVRFRRIVFVGTPNSGTDLADPKNLSKAIDWLANIAEVMSGSAVAVAMGAIFSITAMVVEAGFKALPGLVDQAVDADSKTGPLLQLLDHPAQPPANVPDYFGVEASFEPKGRLLAAAVAFGMRKAFRDKDNDLVVPTDGVSVFGPVPIPGKRVKKFTPEDGQQIHHLCYFGNQLTWDHIRAALT